MRITDQLKYGFHNKSFILNAPLVSCPFPVIHFGWVCCCTYPKRMTGNGQLTTGAFRINVLLRNPHFSRLQLQLVPIRLFLMLSRCRTHDNYWFESSFWCPLLPTSATPNQINFLVAIFFQLNCAVSNTVYRKRLALEKTKRDYSLHTT